MIGWPQSKLFNQIIQTTLWALSFVLEEALLLYLGVIYCISIIFTKTIRRVSAVQMFTHFFVITPFITGEKKVNQPIWTKSQINHIFKTTLVFLSLEAELISIYTMAHMHCHLQNAFPANDQP